MKKTGFVCVALALLESISAGEAWADRVGPRRHGHTRNDGAQQSGARRKGKRRHGTTQGIHQAQAGGLVGEIMANIPLRHIVGDIHQNLIGSGANVRDRRGHGCV